MRDAEFAMDLDDSLFECNLVFLMNKISFLMFNFKYLINLA